MSVAHKELSLFEASAIVAGLGIGGGVMAVPYLASLSGLIPILILIAAAYLLSLLFHLLLAEAVMRDGQELQIVELFSKYLFKGRAGPFFAWVFFLLVSLTILASLAGFIVGCGEILADLFSIPLWTGEILMYVVAAGVVFFGLKVLGISEKYAILGMIVLLVVLTGWSFTKPLRGLPLMAGGVKEALALYGMLMFCFACLFAIPQVVKGLSSRKHLIPWSIVLGLGINLGFVLVITLMANFASDEVTGVAIIGWTRSLGDWAQVIGSLSVLLAMLTTYWGSSYALAVILDERLMWGGRLSWLVATLPTLILALSGLTGFIGFMRLTAGATAVLIVILAVPTYRGTVKYGQVKDPAFTTGFWGKTGFQLLIIVAFIVMAVGSMVPVGP